MPTAVRREITLLLLDGAGSVRGCRVYRETERGFDPLLKHSEDEVSNRYSGEMHDPACLFLIAEADGEPHGYLCAHLDRVPYLGTA